MSKPRVSVIIPTYKRSEMLPRAIESVLRQTLENIEVIVVDDNDPDTDFRKETEKRMERYANNPKVIYIKHEKNRNGAAARNTGIKYAKGDYIAFLDDDDEFMPEKLALQVKRMDSLSNVWGACYTAYKKINRNGIIQYSSEKREGDLLTIALMKNLYIGSGSNIFIRREVVDVIGGYDESFKRNQDLEFLVRVLEKYKISYVDYCGLVIHYEVRNQRFSYDELINIKKHYLQKFESLITSLDKAEQKRIYVMLALMDFRDALSRKMIFEAIRNLKKEKVSCFTTIRYLAYIVNRAITKKSYGFKI